MTEIVLPNDTNVYGNLRGGRVLHWMDIAAAVSAQRHSGAWVVTAAVDNVSFNHPIKLGSVVMIESKVTRAFKTSMEVFIEVWAEDITRKRRFKSNEAFYTFVAIDDYSHPIQVPHVEPETEAEKKLFEDAQRRRELRLILAKRMKPEDSKELKALFTGR